MKNTIYLLVILAVFGQLNLQGQTFSGFGPANPTGGFMDFPGLLFGGGTTKQVGITHTITSLESWETWVSRQPRPIRDLVKYYEDQMALTVLGRMGNDPRFRAAVRRHYGESEGKLEPLARRLARGNMARFQYWRAHKNGHVVLGGFQIALRAAGPHGKGVHAVLGFYNGAWSHGANTRSMAGRYVDNWIENVIGATTIKGDGLVFQPMDPAVMQMLLPNRPRPPLHLNHLTAIPKISVRFSK